MIAESSTVVIITDSVRIITAGPQPPQPPVGSDALLLPWSLSEVDVVAVMIAEFSPATIISMPILSSSASPSYSLQLSPSAVLTRGGGGGRNNRGVLAGDHLGGGHIPAFSMLRLVLHLST
jgi:hypothetical protein